MTQSTDYTPTDTMGIILIITACIIVGIAIGITKWNRSVDYTLVCDCNSTDFDGYGPVIVCKDCGKKYLK